MIFTMKLEIMCPQKPIPTPMGAHLGCTAGNLLPFLGHHLASNQAPYLLSIFEVLLDRILIFLRAEFQETAPPIHFEIFM